MTPLIKISLRYALILAGIHVVLGLLIAFTVNYEEPSPFLTISLGVLGFALFILIIALAHVEIHKQNGNKISFGEAIGSGYIIVAVSVVTSAIVSFITLTYIAPPPPDSYGTAFSPGRQVMAGFLSGVLVNSIILFIIILFEAQWKVYTKAGRPGWATIVPLYNVIVLLEIVKKPMSWFILLLIPGVNIIFGIWVLNLLSKRFGKDEGFTVGMVLLPFIFYPILGFGSATYNNGELEVRPA